MLELGERIVNGGLDCGEYIKFINLSIQQIFISLYYMTGTVQSMGRGFINDQRKISALENLPLVGMRQTINKLYFL